MELLNKNEHLNCFNYDHTEYPPIEAIRIAKETGGKLCVNCSEIIFFMEGRLRYTSENNREEERVKGQFLFLPSGSRYQYMAHSNTVIIVFRLYESIRFCPGFKIERLYGIKKINMKESRKHQNKLVAMEITPRLWHLLDGVLDCLSDGIQCKSYFDLKIKEFFIMLRAYYSKEQLHDFFSQILSPDTAFSEYVRQNWQQYPTVIELAASIPLTTKQFNKRFKDIFGTTPYKWMKEGKAQHILQEITATSKSYKQIALENGFSTVQQFTKFCNNELGKTPSGIRCKEKYNSGAN